MQKRHTRTAEIATAERCTLALIGATCALLLDARRTLRAFRSRPTARRPGSSARDFEGTYDSFGQNLEWNHDNRAFDSHGNQVAGPGTNTFVGLSTFIHYWKLPSLPHVGFNASITRARDPHAGIAVFRERHRRSAASAVSSGTTPRPRRRSAFRPTCRCRSDRTAYRRIRGRSGLRSSTTTGTGM